MKKRINISRKVTFEGTTSSVGSVILFVSIYLMFVQNKYTLFLIFFACTAFLGFMMILSIKGTLIDLENKRVKSYIHCLFFKLGTWKSINEIERIVLEYVNQAKTLGSRGAQTTLQTEILVVLFRYSSGKKIAIKEFLNYEKAKEFLDTYSELLQIEKRDRYEYMLSEIAKIR